MRRHLTFANVVSVVALFFALSGGSYAAVSLAGKEEPVATTTTSSSTVSVEAGGEISTDANSASGALAASQQPDQIESEVRPPQAAGPETSEQDVEHRSDRSERTRQESPRHVGGAEPPARAPAHGYRCQQDGFDPGSDQFVDCVHSGHP